MKRSRARGPLIGVLVGVVALLSGACSSDAPGPQNGVNGTLAPLTLGGSCDDPKGDVGNDPTRAGSRSEPSGIDVVKAEAKVNETSMVVSFETAGPIAPTPAPVFIVSQGPAGRTVSFEVRAEPGADPAQPWSLTLVTWKVTTQGVTEVRAAMAQAVIVTGATLKYEIPLKDLPAIATLIWQFGATSGGDSGLFDDCSSFAPAQLPPETVAGSTTPTTARPEPKLGEAQTHVDGAKITIYEVQDPPKKPQKLDVQPEAGNKLVLVDAQICAGAERRMTASANHFGVQLATNQLYPIWDQKQTTVDPNYPEFPRSQRLNAGDCIRGWLTFSVPQDAQISEAFYTEHPVGDDAVTWKILPAPAAPTSTAAR